MPDDREEEERAERPRPRIVDKRRSARASTSPSRESSTGPTPGVGDGPSPSTQEPAQAAQPSQPSQPPESVPAGSQAPPPPSTASDAPVQEAPPGGPGEERVWTPEEEEAAQQMARELAERPSADWVLNVAVTLANVAGAKIQLGVPEDARLAIDTLEAIVNGVAAQLEGAEAPLRQTLAQLQMAYAQAIQPPPAAP